MGREAKLGTGVAEAAVVVMDQPARNVAVGDGWVLERNTADVSYSHIPKQYIATSKLMPPGQKRPEIWRD